MRTAARLPRCRKPTPPKLYLEVVPEEAADPASTISSLQSCATCGAKMVTVARCCRDCKCSIYLQDPLLTTPREKWPACVSDQRKWMFHLELDPSTQRDVVRYTAKDDATLFFREDEPKEWVLYRDLDNRMYWWNEVTREWFWRPRDKDFDGWKALRCYA